MVEGNCPTPSKQRTPPVTYDLQRKNVAYVISTGIHKFSCRFSCFHLLSPAPNLLQHAHHNFLRLMASHLQLDLWPVFCQRHLWQISPSLKLAQSHSPLFHYRPVASDGQLDFGLTSCHSAQQNTALAASSLRMQLSYRYISGCQDLLTVKGIHPYQKNNTKDSQNKVVGRCTC